MEQNFIYQNDSSIGQPGPENQRYSPPKDCIFVQCQLNGRPAKGIIDTGAQITVMSRALVNELGLEGHMISDRSIKFKGANGEEFLAAGRLKAKVKLNGKTIRQYIFVIDGQPDIFLLGMDFCKKVDIFLDITAGKVYFRGCEQIGHVATWPEWDLHNPALFTVMQIGPNRALVAPDNARANRACNEREGYKYLVNVRISTISRPGMRRRCRIDKAMLTQMLKRHLQFIFNNNYNGPE